MAEKILNTRIRVLNDTTAALEAKKTSVPLGGEIVYDNQLHKMKIGDGTTTLENLKFVGGDEAQNFEAIPIEGQSDVEAIAAAVGSAELHAGDTAIVKRTIAGDKISYTAYVYDDTWKAMDGNYNAKNVYFDKNLTFTANIGVKTVPASGSGTIAAEGKNVEEVLASILAEEKNPSKTNPVVSFSAQGGFGTFEIGTKKNLTYTASLSAGSYTYGPATGITAESWTVKCTGVEDALATATGTFENVVAEATAKKITATATYNEGSIPKTNLGNPYPAGKIPGGSASKDSNVLQGVRYMFWGPMISDVALNSANIRGLAHNKASGAGALATFGAGANAKKVIVAVPAGRKITKVIMPSALNADVTTLFVKQGTTVSVEGVNGYAGTAYDVYVYQPASIDAGETYTVTIG